MIDLSQSQLKDVLDYNPDTGIFTWKTREGDNYKSWNKKYPGKRAGAKLTRIRYRTISINKTAYYEHRLAYLYMVGRWPDDVIDHINHIEDDNRWCNLRPAKHH